MRIRPGNGKSRKDNSLGFLHGEAASASIESAGCGYQDKSLLAAHATEQEIALLSTVTNLVLAFMLIRVPSLLDGQASSLKRKTVILAVFGCVTWLPIILVTLFVRGANPLLLIALWTLSLVPTTLLYPLRDSWMASLVPGEQMGRYLSWRSAIAGACYLGTYLLMGILLNQSGGEAFSFAFILAIAFLASTISLVFYCFVRPPPKTAPAGGAARLGFVNFLRNARQSHLGTFILFVTLYTFAVNLAGPLFSSYMFNDLRFSYFTMTVIVSSEYVARILSITFWGKMVDRAGSLRVLSVATYFIPFVPVMWIFSPSYLYLSGVQILSGTVWAAFDLSVQTFIYKATPPDQRLRYIVYHRSLTSFAAAMGAITGAFLVGHIFAINGSQILAVFLVSGTLRLVISRIMLPRMTPEGIPNALVHPELAVELAAVPAPSHLGLYYYPGAWRRLSQRAAKVGNVIGRISRATVTQNGLFYQPAHWQEYLRKEGLEVVPAELYRHAPVREGLFYHRESWGEAQAQLVKEHDRRVAGERAVSRGLFNNPAAWGDYLKRSLVMDGATMRTGTEGMVLRQPVFYHPEMWEAYQKQTATKTVKAARTASAREPLLYHPEEWQKAAPVEEKAVAVKGPAVARKALFYHPEDWEKAEARTGKKRSGGRARPVLVAAGRVTGGDVQINRAKPPVTRRPRMAGVPA